MELSPEQIDQLAEKVAAQIIKKHLDGRQPSRLALSLQETAESLGVCTKTVSRLIQRGKIPTVPGIRHKLIPVKEIERFLSQARIHSSAKFLV